MAVLAAIPTLEAALHLRLFFVLFLDLFLNRLQVYHPSYALVAPTLLSLAHVVHEVGVCVPPADVTCTCTCKDA